MAFVICLDVAAENAYVFAMLSVFSFTAEFISARVILGSSETLQKLDLAVFHGLTKHIANIEPNIFR